MIVEFCGVPGAGKSYLAGALATDLRALGHAVSQPLEPVSPRRSAWSRIPRKVGRAVAEGVRHPVATTAALRAVGRSGQPSARDVVLRSLNWLVLRSALRRARSSRGIHLIDQGVVQELCSIGFRGDAAAALDIADPGVERLAPDVIVMVDVDSSLADQRLEQRPGNESRLEGLGVDRRRELERQADLTESLLSSWVGRFGRQIPTVVQRVENGSSGPHPDVRSLAVLLTADCAPTCEVVAS